MSETLVRKKGSCCGGLRSLVRLLPLFVVAVAVVFLLGCNQPQPGAAGQQGGPISPKDFIFMTVQFFLMAFAVYYFLVLLPGQKKIESHENFLKELKKNDEVKTSSGFFARVVAVKPEYVTLELAPNVKVKVDPAHVHPVSARPASDDKQEKASNKESK